MSPKAPATPVPPLAFPALVKLSIENYRQNPSPREYALRNVNLLSGPNGSGKTSFLEAIELCLCGKTLRNQKEEGAKLKVELTDGRVERYQEQEKKYRERDQRLYGRVYRRGNDMPDSFARYNFFSSDAAYRLAYEDNPERITSAFTELILGEEATRVSARLDGFQADLEKAKKQLANGVENSRTSIAALKVEIEGIRQSLDESTSEQATVASLFQELPLTQRHRDGNEEPLLSTLSNALSRLSATMDEVDWIRPLSAGALRAERTRLIELQGSVAHVREESERSGEALRGLSTRLSQIARDRALLGKASLLLAIPAIEVTPQVNQRVRSLRQVVRNVTGIEPLRRRLSGVSGDEVSFSREFLDEGLEALAEQVADAQETLDAARSDLDRATDLRTSIRELASELLDLLPEEGTCPVCGEKHGASDLRNRLGRLEVVDDAERRLSSATRELSQIQRQVRALRKQRKLRSDFDELLGLFEARSGASTAEEADEFLRQLAEKCAGAEAELSRLDALVASLEEQGLTVEETIDFSRDLEERVGVGLFNGIENDVSGRLATLDEERTMLSQQRQAMEREHEASNTRLESLLRSAFPGLREPEHILPLIPERLSAVDRALDRHEVISESLSLLEDADFGDLRSKLDSAARRLRAAVSFRQQLAEASEMLRSSNEALQAEEDKLASMLGPLERVGKADSVLVELRNEEGIQRTLDAFLHDYKQAILAIFQTIHTPAEFGNLMLGHDGNDAVVLVRRDGRHAQLTEISTGQRAALALSIFLALNRSVKDRLNLILIDDPVANVDDLNSLAFLDFLRNVAVSGTQVLFATADAKLAKLFEMKFAPLGQDMFQVVPFAPKPVAPTKGA
ncbi:MAG: AAA family ATPase [Myxococcales bacterium]|nr:AAA family ATPase [Myxococcales bacterium]